MEVHDMFFPVVEGRMGSNGAKVQELAFKLDVRKYFLWLGTLRYGMGFHGSVSESYITHSKMEKQCAAQGYFFQTDACQCLMDANERKECNSTSKGITAEKCTANGCCFDATVPDVPWCFRPSGERGNDDS
ncbi:Trefoil factor 3 [Varanus komodoensis]|nr:Trefoil factor 3 [Varanus komodoensis]